MEAAIIGLIIAAAITATRSSRHTRWPLLAAVTMAVLPFVVVGVMKMTGNAAVAALRGLETSSVAWPVAWALFLGWFFRAARKPFGAPRLRKRKP